MAGTWSATPRGASARADAGDRGIWEQFGWRAQSHTIRSRALEAIALTNLMAITYWVTSQDAGPTSIIPVGTGLFLVVAAMLHARQANGGTLTDLEMPAFIDADHTAEPIRNVELERQSQRLAEIADAATRARRDAEIREHLWSDLTHRMSHELRTPLNAVIGFSDMMHAELFGPVGHDRYRDYIRHIRESGRDLLKSTEDTLALTELLGSPASHEAQRPLNLAAFIDDAWSFFDDGERNHQPVLAVAARPGIEIVAERRPARQLLINLLAEAAVRAGPDGSIEITAREQGSVVELEISVPGGEPRPEAAPRSLSLCIARALADLTGSTLIESVAHGTTWRVVTVFDAATQRDFFHDTAR